LTFLHDVKHTVWIPWINTSMAMWPRWR